jgi:hypothetical protein
MTLKAQFNRNTDGRCMRPSVFVVLYESLIKPESIIFIAE